MTRFHCEMPSRALASVLVQLPVGTGSVGSGHAEPNAAGAAGCLAGKIQKISDWFSHVQLGAKIDFSGYHLVASEKPASNIIV